MAQEDTAQKIAKQIAMRDKTTNVLPARKRIVFMARSIERSIIDMADEGSGEVDEWLGEAQNRSTWVSLLWCASTYYNVHRLHSFKFDSTGAVTQGCPGSC